MKKVCKIITIFLLILSLYSVISTVKASDIWQTGNKFLNKGSGKGTANIDIGEIWKGAGNAIAKANFKELIDFLWGIGLLVVFASTMILGIKYMLVNPNEKSRVKQATTPYIIGVVIIFGALTIWKLLIEILEGGMGLRSW